MKPVKLAKSTDIWQKNFEEIQLKIQSLLGNMVIEIEHIGSTSIPGLPAKDIVDIQVGVRDFNCMADVKKKLKIIDFCQVEHIKQDHKPFCDPSIFDKNWEKRFFKGYYLHQHFNIHIRIHKSDNWNFAHQFKWLLTNNEQVKKAYLQVKERLVNAEVSKEDYCLIKDPVIDIISLLMAKTI